MIRRKPEDAASNAAAAHRRAIAPLCQCFTRRVRSRSAAWLFFRWHASDDVFELPPDSTKLGLRGTLDTWIQRVTHPHVIGYKVLAISENEIRMWTRNPTNQQSLVTMRRIADGTSPE